MTTTSTNHVCPTDVANRLSSVWNAAAQPITSKPGDAAAATFVEVIAILGEHGIESDVEQERILRWLCGWEWTTVAALVELMVARYAAWRAGQGSGLAQIGRAS